MNSRALCRLLDFFRRGGLMLLYIIPHRPALALRRRLECAKFLENYGVSRKKYFKKLALR